MQLATSSPSFEVFGCVKAREIRWTLTAIALPKDLLKYLLNASICHGNGNCISVAIEIFQLTRLIKVYGLNYARVLFALNYWPALT